MTASGEPPASTAVKVRLLPDALEENVIEPLMLAFAPVATLIFKLVSPVVPEMLSCESADTISESAAAR